MNKFVLSLTFISVTGLIGAAIYYREPLFGTVDFSSDKYQNNVLVNDEFLDTRVSSNSVFSQEEQDEQTGEWTWTENGIKKTLKITNVPDFWLPDPGARISTFSVKFKEDNSDKYVFLKVKIHEKNIAEKGKRAIWELKSCWFSYNKDLGKSKFLMVPTFDQSKSASESDFVISNGEIKSKQEALSDFYKNYFSSNTSVDCSSKKQDKNITIT